MPHLGPALVLIVWCGSITHLRLIPAIGGKLEKHTFQDDKLAISTEFINSTS